MDLNERKEDITPSKVMCVACGSLDVYSEPYRYKQVEKAKVLVRLRKKESSLTTLEVPACQKCFKMFKRWKLYNFFSMFIFIFSLISVVIGVIFLIFYQIFSSLGVPLIGFSFIFVVGSLFVRYAIGKIESNPQNYIFYDNVNEILYVKPKGEINWIHRKVKNFRII
jgi:hypothetical protein